MRLSASAVASHEGNEDILASWSEPHRSFFVVTNNSLSLTDKSALTTFHPQMQLELTAIVMGNIIEMFELMRRGKCFVEQTFEPAYGWLSSSDESGCFGEKNTRGTHH